MGMSDNFERKNKCEAAGREVGVGTYDSTGNSKLIYFISRAKPGGSCTELYVQGVKKACHNILIYTFCNIVRYIPHTFKLY